MAFISRLWERKTNKLKTDINYQLIIFWCRLIYVYVSFILFVDHDAAAVSWAHTAAQFKIDYIIDLDTNAAGEVEMMMLFITSGKRL